MEPLFTRWVHRPAHLFQPDGVYMVTAGTVEKAPLFRGAERLRVLQGELFAAATTYDWRLQAWAIFANHYHFVAEAPADARTLTPLIQRLHSATARWCNRRDGQRGRQVWYQYWDTCICFEASYYARLNYVHNNPVQHGIVDAPQRYEFCSAAQFAAHADHGLYERLRAQRYDTLKVPDDF